MISVTGKYYDGIRSDAIGAIFCVFDTGEIRVKRSKDNQPLASTNLDQVRISPRLANTPRFIRFPDGEQFETEDNDSIDTVLEKFKRHSWTNVVHLLESRKKYLIIGILILAVFMAGSIKYGIPAASKVIAYWLPSFAIREASDQTIRILDRSVLKVSELQEGRREQLIRYFEPVIAAHGSYGIKIFFRKGGPIGANAFALPDGRIVFTDEMVGISEHDDELVAVLVHEIGHVVHRHSMRSLIQGSLLGFTLLAITGDVTGSSELFLGLPVLLTELSYSREFEREADHYVLEWFVSHSLHPEHFSNLMLRIEQKKHSMPNQAAKKWLSYLSSHPMTDDRVKRFKREGGHVKKKTDNP